MPRQARERSGTGIYHVMLRGVNKQNIFEDDEDRQRFIGTVRHYKGISGYKLYGYCLMNNRLHLLIEEAEESISAAMKRISCSYAHWYNKKYNRCGHLFQERYRSEAVGSNEYFLTVLRYIHHKPKIAGINQDISRYSWSSYHEYIGTPSVADTDFALNLLSENRIKATALFIFYTNEEPGDECLDYRERTHLSDKEITACFKDLGIADMSELRGLEKAKRNDAVRKVKEMQGVTIRQLARITEISKSVIGRI